MSNQAYQATEEDVKNVLHSNKTVVAVANADALNKLAKSAFADLDFDLIEQAALYGDDLDAQTNYANDEIARQLRGAGILAPLPEIDTPAEELAPRR